jgi:transcriptional regulator
LLLMVYLPPHFTETDPKILAAHIERYDFALLVTNGAGGMIASQIPVLSEQRDGKLYLQGHLARQNPQCADFDGKAEALAIFAGPHAYVSPGWYQARPAVPTWNYASVHAYGKARAIDDAAWLDHFLHRLSARHEAREPNPWSMDDEPRPFLDGMLKGIVGFEIAVERCEGKFKLSQNRPAADRPRIVSALEAREDQESHGVAALMRAREK